MATFSGAGTAQQAPATEAAAVVSEPMDEGETKAPAESSKDTNADAPAHGAEGKPTEMTRYVCVCAEIQRGRNNVS